MLFRGSTLDDALYRVLKSLLVSRRAYSVVSTRKASRELVGALIRIENPRARMSIATVRGQLFSCLGELFWYLSGSDDVDQIAYYISKYKEESDDGKTVRSAYGPRLFRMRGINQIDEVIKLLRLKPSSRRAVIQLYDAGDLRATKSPPCTCFLQFFIRGGQLHAFASMRSNDAFIGLPHDVFAFTMLQEILAKELGLGLGTYSHAVGSLHLYAENEFDARQYLDEGFQERVFMPPMPDGSAWHAIRELVDYERAVRIEGCTTPAPSGLDDYWKDIGRLLAIYAAIRGRQLSKGSKLSFLNTLRSEMSSSVFDFAIEKRARRLRKPGVITQAELFNRTNAGDINVTAASIAEST